MWINLIKIPADDKVKMSKTLTLVQKKMNHESGKLHSDVTDYINQNKIRHWVQFRIGRGTDVFISQGKENL